MNFIFFIVTFAVGLLSGLIGYDRIVSSSSLDKAIALCSTNSGIAKLEAGITIHVVCANGGRFQIKEQT